MVREAQHVEKEKAESGELSSNGRILLATVKGDVHDIGKNIVGVVLQCNNYEVIDLGVMVPYEKILAAAKEENADIIGLSGLITPSLEEMVSVARELNRDGFDVPVLIGGATTSKVHTAVKIAPNYDGTAIYVTDASRAVGVASNLLNDSQRDEFVAEIDREYTKLREAYEGADRAGRLLPLADARQAGRKDDWRDTPQRPFFLGVREFDNYDLGEIATRIDWTPFFRTWELAGRYPSILEDQTVGEAARSLFNDAQVMLQRIIGEQWLTAKAVTGFFPANAVGDDIEIYTDDSRTEVRTVIPFLRQQMAKSTQGGRANLCLADFIAPKESGIKDYIGGFAVTAGLGIEEKLREFAESHDDYNDILLKALADRLAEAFAERMHERTRREFWGYQSDESFSNEELIKEQYTGIRPAPGYPACPDHSIKPLLFDLLEAESKASIDLTESFAMMPAASVSGFYFSHPQSSYFGIGKIGRDQVEDYARRRKVKLTEAEKWLAPNIA